MAAATLLPGVVAAAETKPKGARRIDAHHHFLPQKYMAEEHERLSGYTHGSMTSDRLLHWTPEQALETMDKNGIEWAIASISTPGVWFGDVAAARRLSREWNEAAAKTIADHPGRFGLFAVVAPPDTEGALKEIEYSLDTLKADGIGLLSNYDGKELGDPSFVPVFEELSRRKALIYVHPTVAPCCAALIPGTIPQNIEFPLDTTRTITSLIVAGTFAKYPDLRFIFSHGGGAMPFVSGRIIETFSNNKAVAARNPKGIEYELKKLYVDTASANSVPALAATMAFMPRTHVLFGTDYPFVAPEKGVEGIDHYKFAPGIRRDIDRDNALRLLPRLGKA
jgi:predicted TIM-barrel fold metal-dependent hydrolase